jgi:hypothetical protein
MRLKFGRLLISISKGDKTALPETARAGWRFLIALGVGKRTFNLGYRSNSRPSKYRKTKEPALFKPVWMQNWRWGRWYFVILTDLKD